MSRKAAVIMGITAAILGVTSLAFACTVQARILTIDPPAGFRGSTVKVEGQAIPVDGVVEVRWNGLKGQPIGSGMSERDSSPQLGEARQVDPCIAAAEGEYFFAKGGVVRVVVMKQQPRRHRRAAPGDGSKRDVNAIGARAAHRAGEDALL